MQSVYEKEADRERYINFGKHEVNRGQYCGMHFHDAAEIVFVLEGDCYVRIGAEEFVLSPGDIAYIPRYELHAYHGAPRTLYYVFVVSSGYFNRFNRLADCCFPRVMKNAEASAKLRTLLDFSFPEFNEANESFRFGLLNMVIGLLEAYFPMQPWKRNRTSEVLVEALCYIGEHYAEDVTLATLADRFGYSPNYFSNLLNRMTGMNLREHLNRRRLAVYIRLRAEEPALSVERAAEMAGFQSANTLYRTIKRYQDIHKNRNF